jgi:uncharacterized protein involved in exopolysaccharide biosynthesis
MPPTEQDTLTARKIDMTTPNHRPLFPQRTLLILIAAIAAGLIFGGIMFAAYGNPWVAVGAGLTAFGAVLTKLPGLVE